ncbi:hypothetical protein CLV84_0386 [Neolewinella xylanilytica]|uniref:Uncharacterized protein n=1 Tax=Neolewinella xylanilytica TaxID=1514080 RepID=A0A2S6I7F3_9BACT|nr:hypothetical protein CLV84_0386 [Neolewinella xylanilytica]
MERGNTRSYIRGAGAREKGPAKQYPDRPTSEKPIREGGSTALQSDRLSFHLNPALHAGQDGLDRAAV